MIAEKSAKTGDEAIPIPLYKFQKLEVYRLALDYVDLLYTLARKLPEAERFNLKAQIEGAAISIVLNIAEGSTGQSNPEQLRFLSFSIRSFLESVACLDLIERRQYLPQHALIGVRQLGHKVFVKLQAFRKSLQ
ncbi:MAG: four helix bundle protein [candidate division NC10 bacterium]|nr:four helix bundle protein [candidate division NC10 bacterium]